MADLEVQLHGVEELRAKMRKLPEAIARRAMRRALRKGAAPIRVAARANAQRIDDPTTRDMISKNIAIQSGSPRREQANGGPMVRVGVMGGARPTPRGTESGLPGGDTTHWRFVEFGTSEARAQPFMRPAMASSANAVFDTTLVAMDAEMEKEINRLGIR